MVEALAKPIDGQDDAYKRWNDMAESMANKALSFGRDNPDMSHVRTETAGELLLSDRQKETIRNAVSHPAFKFETADGKPFYTEEKLKELYSAMAGLMQRVETEHKDLSVPERIETILAEDEDTYKFSRAYTDITTRTAYSLLCGDKKGSNCIGFGETCCSLLDLYGYEAAPVISRLNKRGLSAHYVTAYRDTDGNVKILDPERKRSCSNPEKQFNLTAYQVSIRYAVPDEDYCQNKFDPETGKSPIFDDFFSGKPDGLVRKPIESITISPESEEARRMNLFEEQSDGSDPRIELSEKSMNPEKQRILDEAIAKTLEPLYEASLAMKPKREFEEDVYEEKIG